MELYVSGVKPPKLGSVQDVITRRFLLKKVNKEVTLNKLLAQLVNSSHESKQWSSEITNIWTDYVNLAYYSEEEVKKVEDSMQQEYEFWKHVKPVLHKGPTGGFSVSGLPENLLPKKA